MMPLVDLLKITGVAAIWGLSFVAIKIGVHDAPPLFLSAVRFVLACFPAVFLLPRPKVPVIYLIGYGVFLGVCQFGLTFMALKLGAPAGLSSLVIQLQAFFTIGMAALVFGDRPGPAQWIGAIAAIAGCIVIGSERLGAASKLWPLLMVIAAGFAWAVANIISKKAGKVDMLAFVAWGSLSAPLPLFALSFVFDGQSQLIDAVLHPSLIAMGCAAYLGWVATNFGFGVWGDLLSRYPTSLITPFSLLVPVFGFLGGSVFFHEPITRLEIIGAGLIFCGLMINVFGSRLAPLIPNLLTVPRKLP